MSKPSQTWSKLKTQKLKVKIKNQINLTNLIYLISNQQKKNLYTIFTLFLHNVYTKFIP